MHLIKARGLLGAMDLPDPLPEGATITVEGGQFVLVAPATGDLVDAGHANTTNPDLIDAGNATATNPDLFDGGTS